MSITLEEAQRIVAAAHEHARAEGLRVAVAVVDEGGVLQAFGRMDGVPTLSAQIAEAKAAGAAVWHKDGDEMVELERERPAFFAAVSRLARLPILPAMGAVTIRAGAAVQGAVGVSGATSEQDHECARHAIAAVLDG